MTKFTWNDTVATIDVGKTELRPGQTAWIVGICADDERGDYHKLFPRGTIYTIEFEDGISVDVHEDNLCLRPIG